MRRVPVPKWFAPELELRVGKLVLFEESDHFNRAVRLRSGVKRFRAHRCRHSFACDWIERGGSLAALQSILGHSSIVTTQRYGRISDGLVMREAERIERKGVANGVAKPQAIR